jgi:hypothetical protein
MADGLGDLGETGHDRTLVLSVLEKFAYMGAILKRQKPFPTFNEVKNDLLVEEIFMAKPAAPCQALVACSTHRADFRWPNSCSLRQLGVQEETQRMRGSADMRKAMMPFYS